MAVEPPLIKRIIDHRCLGTVVVAEGLLRDIEAVH